MWLVSGVCASRWASIQSSPTGSARRFRHAAPGPHRAAVVAAEHERHRAAAHRSVRPRAARRAQRRQTTCTGARPAPLGKQRLAPLGGEPARGEMRVDAGEPQARRTVGAARRLRRRGRSPRQRSRFGGRQRRPAAAVTRYRRECLRTCPLEGKERTGVRAPFAVPLLVEEFRRVTAEKGLDRRSLSNRLSAAPRSPRADVVA